MKLWRKKNQIPSVSIVLKLTWIENGILGVSSDDWQYMSTNTTVKKKNQIPSLSMLELI